MKGTFLILGLVIAAGGATVSGHHYFGTDYFEEQSISIEGSVVEFNYRNPHSWVHVLVEDGEGRKRQIGAEWGSPVRLGAQGVTKDTIRPGDRVIITGSPPRDPSTNSMHLKKIQRPADGWQWVAAERR